MGVRFSLDDSRRLSSGLSGCGWVWWETIDYSAPRADRLQLLVEVGPVQVGELVEPRTPGAQVVVVVHFVVGSYPNRQLLY